MNARHLDPAETPHTHFPVTSSTSATRDRTGEVIAGKWRLQKLLGTGGASSVYAATHKNGKRVALKLLHPEFVNNAVVRARFLREPRATNLVEHKGVVSVHDEGNTADGGLFFVMDLLQGCTLDQHVATSPRCDWPAALEIAERVLDVLIAAHRSGVIHRDIKPANVFLSKERGVCLLDFGIASIAQDTSLTESGVPLGTPAYMSPEQARANWQLVNQRADIWGVGALLWFCFTASPPRRAKTVDEALDAAQRHPLPSLSKVSTVPRAVSAFVDRALCFDSERRFGDAQAMLTELRAVRSLLQSRRLVATPDELTPIAMPRAVKRWSGIRSTAVSALVLLTAIGLLSGEQSASSAQRYVHSRSMPFVQLTESTAAPTGQSAVANRPEDILATFSSTTAAPRFNAIALEPALSTSLPLRAEASQEAQAVSQQPRKLKLTKQKSGLAKARHASDSDHRPADIQPTPSQTAEAFDPLSARL